MAAPRGDLLSSDSATQSEVVLNWLCASTWIGKELEASPLDAPPGAGPTPASGLSASVVAYPTMTIGTITKGPFGRTTVMWGGQGQMPLESWGEHIANGRCPDLHHNCRLNTL